MSIYSFFQELFTNKILLSIILAWFVSQTIKVLIMSIKKKKLRLDYYITGSGMPSSHTAIFVALTYSIYLLEGISNLFIVTLIITLVIMDEVLGFLSIQKIVHVLNYLLDTFEVKQTKLREDIGHTIPEVIVGFLIGMLVTYYLFFIF